MQITLPEIRHQTFSHAPNLTRRKVTAALSYGFFGLTVLISVASLITLLVDVFLDGYTWLSWTFLSNYASQLYPEQAGILAPLAGTFWVIVFTAAMCIPLGIATAVYLEEFAGRGRVIGFIQLNISNLAGVPSIVYGLLGLVLFVQILFGGSRNILAGAMTLGLLVLPIIVIASQEAIRTVPHSRREAAVAIGATKWQVTLHIVLPEALPGVMSGVILALSRAIGETAPILVVSSLVFLQFVPSSPGDRFTVLPLQIYTWVAQPQDEFRGLASAGIIVLVLGLLLLNSAAIYIRGKTQRQHE